MGHDADPADFIQPLAPAPGAAVPGIAAWTWKSLAEPALASLTPSGRQWEMTRYRAYQARLAGRPAGDTFTHATDFLRLAAEAGRLSHAWQTASTRRYRAGTSAARLAEEPAHLNWR